MEFSEVEQTEGPHYYVCNWFLQGVQWEVENHLSLKRHRFVLSTDHHLCLFLMRWKSTFFPLLLVSLVT